MNGQAILDLGHHAAQVVLGLDVGKHVGHPGDVAVVDHTRPGLCRVKLCDVAQVDRRPVLVLADDDHPHPISESR